MNQSSVQWTILGAGAIGHLMACQFAKQHIPATLVCRNKPRNEQSKVAYQFKQKSHEYTLCYQSVADCSDIQYLLLAVKSHQIAAAIRAIKTALTPASRIFLLQNGMGNLELVSELLADKITPDQIYPGSNTHGAYLQTQTNGTVELVHAGEGQIIFGRNYLHSTQNSPPECLNRLKQLRLNVSWVDDIERRLWLKLAINAAINPLTAIHKCHNGALLDDKTLKSQLLLLCLETAELFKCLAINITEDELTSQVYDVILKTADNHSSMLQDRQAGKNTEIESITGYLLAKAQFLGIELKAHQSLYDRIQNF